jgi:hypothetical protein
MTTVPWGVTPSRAAAIKWLLEWALERQPEAARYPQPQEQEPGQPEAAA